MARRLALGWAVIAALWCGHTMAVGLGDIKIHSALNQKLDAEIELLDTRGMQQSEILAQLASADDFKRVGVERFFFLTGLKFHVEVASDGAAVLHVTSEAPITEPYLNFLVQVMWPSGRMLKEYTVLLDPPTYKDQAAPVAASPGRSDPGGGPAGRVERTPTRPDSQVSLSSAPRSTQPASPYHPPQDRLSGDSYGMTDRDDTLWAIAQRTRPSSDVSVQQNMLAIVRLNPQAFIGGNINLLKAGYKLRLPSEADATAVSATEAVNQVAEQNQAWQAYRRGEPLSAVAANSSAPAAPAEAPALAGQMDATAEPSVAKAPSGPDGELRIVAGDNAAGGTGAGGGNADAAALEGQLAATKEEADRISRERDEAVGRLDQVTSQAEQAQRQIEVRDKQIAQLQEQMKLLQTQAKSGDAVTPAAKKEPAGGILGMLTSPLVLIGGAIALVLIVVVGLMRARSSKSADDDQLVRYNVPAARSRETKAVAAVAASDDFADAPAEPAEEELKLHEEDREPAHHEGAQTGDVIGEADIYIAYGRYPQAVSLLLSALDEDPDRHDVRLKLLEVYAETKAEAGFETQMQELLTRCNDNELLLEARELEAKLREDDTVVKTVARDEPEPAATALDEFQLDLDADDDALPPQRAAERAPERVADPAFEPDREAADDGHSDDLGGDLGIDFKADDDATVLRSTAASRSKPEHGDVAVATAGEDDEFDLEDIEYEPPPRPKSTAKAAAKSDESDDAFDFLNEEDAATTKLDLARAYIDMGDEDGAREILGEVLQEGSNEQQQTANELLAKMG